MYAMIIGEYPFDGESREKIKERIIGKDVSFAREKRILLQRQAQAKSEKQPTVGSRQSDGGAARI